VLRIWLRRRFYGRTGLSVSGDKDAAFSTWLFALATNLYRSELRRIPAGIVSIDDISEPRDPRMEHRVLEAEDPNHSIRRAVIALPPKYREALNLFYFHEMDVPAAAQSLGLPEGTVKARLFRGRELLRGSAGLSLVCPLPGVDVRGGVPAERAATSARNT
jgi:RNA polymerase sigma factor (sigma-70 family)